MSIRTDWPAEARDLYGILDGIATADGPSVARAVALTLRTAIEEGRIDGSAYDMECGCCCVIGHIAATLGRDVWTGDLPGWTVADDLSPVERLVEGVRPGERPATETRLAIGLALLDEWLVAQRDTAEVAR